jgi:hypothetical protein
MSARLVNPSQPGNPSLAKQIFDICSEAAESAGGFLVPHPDEHAINVVFGGQQVTINVEAHQH